MASLASHSYYECAKSDGSQWILGCIAQVWTLKQLSRSEITDKVAYMIRIPHNTSGWRGKGQKTIQQTLALFYFIVSIAGIYNPWMGLETDRYIEIYRQRDIHIGLLLDTWLSW